MSATIVVLSILVACGQIEQSPATQQVGGIVAAEVSPVTTATLPPENTSTASNNSLSYSMQSIRDVWPGATTVAQVWRRDAYVTRVSTSALLSSTLSPPDVLFTYVSPSEKVEFLGVTCNPEGDCWTLELEDQDQSHTSCPPITLDDFTFDSYDVLEIGLQRATDHYSQLESVCVSLDLNQTDPYRTPLWWGADCNGILHWQMVFFEVSSGDGFYIAVDAVTGDVIRILE